MFVFRVSRKSIFSDLNNLEVVTIRFCFQREERAISNSRIISVTETETTFTARARKPGEPRREITLDNKELIRRFLMHVLPEGFQKIRYYGFLNNRMKSKNLKLIFRLQGYQKFKRRYTDLSIEELLKTVWDFDIRICPECGTPSMRPLGRSYVPLC